jgi:hypothetical protein
MLDALEVSGGIVAQACGLVWEQPPMLLKNPGVGRSVLIRAATAVNVSLGLYMFSCLVVFIQRGEVAAWQEERPGSTYLSRGQRFGNGATVCEMAVHGNAKVAKEEEVEDG